MRGNLLGSGSKMRIALAICLALPPSIGVADSHVYRCETNGKIAFSDQPCGAGAKSSQQTISDTAASSAYDFQVEVSHYPVEGHDYKSLLRSLRERGPGGHHGLASWKVTYDYTTKQRNEVCEIATVRLTVKGAILMPRWVTASDAPVDVQRRWDTPYANLKRHEDGHVQHGKELALLVNAGLVGLGSVPCETLSASADKEYKRIYANLSARDREYDARTHHGLVAE